MTMKTYRAETMSEAIAQVKQDLGRDAVILNTRSFRRNKVLGLFGGKSVWEVTAAPNVNVPKRIGTYVPEEPRDENAADGQGNEDAPAADDETSRLGGQLSDIRRMLESLVSRRRKGMDGEPLDGALGALRNHLLDQDVEEAVANELIGQLRLTCTGRELDDTELLRARLLPLAAARIATVEADPVGGDGDARVIAVIGPTGVGKTTTIAKLAATHKLRRNRRVGLVTIDSYRIAAVDQLMTYARIIEVPLKAVLTPEDLSGAVAEMRRECDVVLIDTAGRSQKDAARLGQLGDFIRAARADEVHLAVSATSNRRNAAETVERFAPLGADRLIVTKLDEAAAFGIMLNLPSADMRISYVTTGQDVPEDIEPADAERLARRIVGDGTYAG